MYQRDDLPWFVVRAPILPDMLHVEVAMLLVGAVEVANLRHLRTFWVVSKPTTSQAGTVAARTPLLVVVLGLCGRLVV